MHRTIRVSIALIAFVALQLLFLDRYQLIPLQIHGLGHLQWIPAIIGFNSLVLVILALLSLLLGRIYCSTLCPLGVYQDIINYIAGKLNRKKRAKRKFVRPSRWFKYTVMVSTLGLGLAGITLCISLFDPYSIYSRIAIHIYSPILYTLNNWADSLLTAQGIFILHQQPLLAGTGVALTIAILNLVFVSICALLFGRFYCNWICPVGSLLGLGSRWALFKVRIDQSRCNGCGACGHTCKANCIDTRNHRIDYANCVMCMSCIGHCKQEAITMRPISNKSQRAEDKQPVDHAKREHISKAILAIPTLSLLSQSSNSQIKTAPKAPKVDTPLSPPGSISIEHFNSRCTACHLCIQKCPNQVLKPSFLEYGIIGMMQPTMDYTNGFCNYGCTDCSHVCPNGAIIPLTEQQKQITQVGKVVFIPQNCIVITDHTSCGACSEHCPTQAVRMSEYIDGLTVPDIDTSICIGCGGCEYICPAQPHKAIYVNGLREHTLMTPIERGASQEIEVNEFGF